MTITNGYATRSELRERLDTDSAIKWTPEDDSAHDSVITAVSRWIDRWTGRKFYAVSETRYFSAEFNEIMPVDDLLSVSEFATDDSGDRNYAAWDSADYELSPANAGLYGEPYLYIETAPNASRSLPTDRSRGVRIAGSFGYCATGAHPTDICEACLLLAMRLWKRKDAIFGVAGAPALGVQIVQANITADADIIAILHPYRRDYF